MSFTNLDIKGVYTAKDDRVDGFFVPVLHEAIAYDRVTGYFRSSALVVAAAGLSRFAAREGKMRIIAGAELEESDVDAILDGDPLDEVIANRLLAADPLEAKDIVSEHRLKTLAYLVREGRLEIRIGVPTDRFDRPLKRAEADRYFHTKYGILTDGEGNRIAFVGSDNESEAGWRENHETFTVSKSWMPEVWSEQGALLCEDFEGLWADKPSDGWAVIDLPQAVREHLIAYAPADAPPSRDPEERPDTAESKKDLIRLRFVRAAPRILGGTGVGYATAGITPWPHQEAIARRAVESYPRSYLLADEVGLGKTIEAGLILRELLITGRAKTALLLVPASVIRQWQEELFEKFALRVPRYTGREFLDCDGNRLDWNGVSPWSAFDVILASSQLARRRSRRPELLDSGPWDVVLVDEAHHARRSGSKPADPPNTLLRLLRDMRARGSWKALYLASATPMQMHLHEAWDLLQLMNLPGRWAESADDFVNYYSQLREPFEERDWDFLARMVADFGTDDNARRDFVIENEMKEALGLAGSRPIRRIGSEGLSPASARELDTSRRAWMDEYLRANTPMRDRVFRTTRQVLRRYKAQGLLDENTNIPRRHVEDRFIPMTKAERKLYDRIDTYISRFYDAYRKGPAPQRGLGFIMTVYRRRLTSSFYAIERSLQRRLDALIKGMQAKFLLDPDDLFALETSGLEDQDVLDSRTRDLSSEVDELREFLELLSQRPPDETKMKVLHDELEDAFRGMHDTVVIFTQYTDSMDYIRDQLVPFYGERIVCYSGRGGERWDATNENWVSLPKEKVKRLFRGGRDVKIMIGTDSLSEGLNLQTCAKLFNYDMPWNFMRVEQRIGRIDRIGGQPRVDITNFFYEKTVEEQIYRGIGEDFDWFQDVVGPAQPVLSQIESTIETVAMEQPGRGRRRDLVERIKEIRRQIEEAKSMPFTLDDMETAPDVDGGDSNVMPRRPSIDLGGLERVLTSCELSAEKLSQHPEIPGAYLLETPRGPLAITFRRTVLDDESPRVRLLTYGTEELDNLLAVVDDGDEEIHDQRFPVGDRLVSTLEELEAALDQQ